MPARSGRTLTTTVLEPATGTGPWPLVVFGPGFDASAIRYLPLLDDLARSGWVVAAPEFPGASSALTGTPDERDLAQEPCDLLFVAGRLQAASIPGGRLSGAVRPGPVALAGHSDGATAAAYAALSLPAGTCGGPPVEAVVAYSAKPVPIRAGASASVFAVTGSAGCDQSPRPDPRPVRRVPDPQLPVDQHRRRPRRPAHHLTPTRRHRRRGGRLPAGAAARRCHGSGSDHRSQRPTRPDARATLRRVPDRVSPVPRQPDIVLILTDQQRHDQVGYASGGHFETPNLDRLAARGTVFDHAYSAATVCVPSRVSMLTGLAAHRVPLEPGTDLHLRQGTDTVARHLRSAGYQTALVGKMHFSADER